MSLGALVSAHTNKTPIDTMIIADTDGSGVAFAAARARLLSLAGQRVAVASRFGRDWATRPNVELLRPALQNIVNAFDFHTAEIIDIAIDNDHPAAAVEAIGWFAEAARAKVAVYDAHPSTRAVAQELLRRGIYVVPASNNADIAEALGLIQSSDAAVRALAIVAIVADRDPSALRYAAREELEQRYLPLANTMDVLVRQPSIVAGEPSSIRYLGDQGRVAALLAENPAILEQLSRSIEYPPIRLAREAAEVVEIGGTAILARLDGTKAAMWVPKTLEQLAIIHRRDVVVAIVHGVDRRTGREYWDVQLLRYWLGGVAPEELERIVAELAQRYNATWRFSGGYGSIRFSDARVAEEAARYAYERIEGRRSTVAHLVNDETVARAVTRDYQRIIELLERIAAALEKGAEAKEKQVRLLEDLYQRDERTRYD